MEDIAAAAVRAWRSFRDSLLFIPTLMTAGALVLFAVTMYSDAVYSADVEAWVEASGSTLLGFFVFAGSASASAAILSAVVGTWATIVGVVFSVTLVTIQLSATKYSAQVIPVFERDRLNQVTLGAFIGTFVYALMLLKTIRTQDGEEFAPLIGVNVTVLLSVASLFLLIAFIGNLTAYMRPTRFVQDYAKRGVKRTVDQRDPVEGTKFRAVQTRPNEEASTSVEIRAASTGYIRTLDWKKLGKGLISCGSPVTRVDVQASEGEHVFQGDIILRAYGASRIPDEEQERLAAFVEVATSPGEAHAGYVAETLADIGVTAMSGGATDVGVAKTAVEGLLFLAAATLERPQDPDAYLLAVEGREVMVVREESPDYGRTYRQIDRVLDKMAQERYWVVAEAFALRVGPVLRNAARTEDDAIWRHTLSWMRGASENLFSFEGHGVLERIAANLRRSVQSLRDDGHGTRALDLEFLLIEIARDLGVLERVRETLATGGPS